MPQGEGAGSRRRGAPLAGLAGNRSLAASAPRFFSAASVASRAASSGVCSSGRPSFLLRSRLSSAASPRAVRRACSLRFCQPLLCQTARPMSNRT